MKTAISILFTLVGILSILFCALTVLAIVLHVIGRPCAAGVAVLPALMWAGLYWSMREFCLCALDHILA